MKTDGTIRNKDVALRNQAGELRTALASVERRPEFNEEECCLTTLVDITERKRAQEALQSAQEFSQATIDGIQAHLCVLDENGTILSVNRAWREFADANPPRPENYCVGSNYLHVCNNATRVNSQEAQPFAEALRAVLQRRIPRL